MLPDGVIEINSEAFSLNQLEKVTLGSGLKLIGVNAFSGNQLKEVLIPAGVNHIDVGSFSKQGPMSSYLIPGEGKNGRLAYNSTYYTQLLLEDPSNPHNLLSWAYTEMDKDDLNANGDTDEPISLGDHIINAAPVKLNFLDFSGAELQPSQYLTGETEDGTKLTSYLVSQAPTPPVPANRWDPTPAELQAISDFLNSTFYTSSRTFSYTPPAINGITPTPASYSGQLT